MRTALDAPNDALDESEQSFVAKIREHGWCRTSVFGENDDPGFSFTTGFCVNASQPDLSMFGMKYEIAHDVFWDLFRDAKAGQGLPMGKRTEGVFGNSPAYAFRVAKRHYAGFLGWSRWFYGGDEFTCLQVVWPDRAGVFPWEAGFAPEFVSSQTDLTETGWAAEIED